MTVKKGKIYYYITPVAVIKLKSIRDDTGKSILGFKILEYLKGNPDDVGHGYALQVGEEISSNQLEGVAIHGVEKYIFDEGRPAIKEVFK